LLFGEIPDEIRDCLPSMSMIEMYHAKEAPGLIEHFRYLPSTSRNSYNA